MSNKHNKKHLDNIPERSNMRCESQGQSKFCIPLSFYQELISQQNPLGAFGPSGPSGPSGDSGNTCKLVPLSLVAKNTDKIHGVLKLKFNSSLSLLAYKLYVYNATSSDNMIINAYLHLGSAVVNGPVVAKLYNGSPKNIDGLVAEGILSNNDIITNFVKPNSLMNNTGAELKYDYHIKNIAALYIAILEGSIYANVSSAKFPNGIIRGQAYFNFGQDEKVPPIGKFV
jgi:hypothetical protein